MWIAGVIDNGSTAVLGVERLLWRLQKKSHSVFKLVEKRGGGRAPKNIARKSRHQFSCTSVHTSYPQGVAGRYRCRSAELAGYRHSSTNAIHSSSNDLWKTFLLRFLSVFSRLPSLPTAMSPIDAIFSFSRTPQNAPRQLRRSTRAARRRTSIVAVDRIDRCGAMGCVLVRGRLLCAAHEPHWRSGVVRARRR
jgi:hypothetical protein